MTDRLGVAAPGSVLLLGEYAVTEPDAPGITLGVLPEVRATCEVRRAPRIAGRMGARRFLWTPGECDSPLFGALVEECGVPCGAIEVDSSALVGGRGKLGLGSSAAVAVAVAALLLQGARPRAAAAVDRERVFAAALAAHRRAQEGRGSGYDVAASVWGGVARFSGGRVPQVALLPRALLPASLCLVMGGTPLATTAAVARYERWRRRERAAAADFRRRSRAAVERLLAAADAADCCAAIAAAGALTRCLGDRIGVAVEPPDLRARLDRLRACGWAAKPVGAGGELGIAAAPADRQLPAVPYVMPIRLAPEGLRWLT